MSKNIGIQIQGDSEKEHFMDVQIEIEREEGLITKGIIVNNILEQSKALLLITHPGEWKTNPILGVGLSGILLDNDYLGYRHRIREQFAMDGLSISSLDLYPNKPFKIDAEYRN